MNEHDANQAALCARYEDLCPAGKKLHDDYDFHLDDIGEDPHDKLKHEMGSEAYDAWRMKTVRIKPEDGLTNALIVAADKYRANATDMRNAGFEALAQQFEEQAAETARYIEIFSAAEEVEVTYDDTDL